MKNPEKLVNNAAFRTLIRRAGFSRARTVIRRAVRPLVLSPARMRRMRERTAGYLRDYFPELGEDEAERRAREFVYHWGCKFAEDVISLNVTRIDDFRRIIDERVEFAGSEHFHRAVRSGKGVLAVGSHVGGVSLGTVALVSLFLEVPRELYPPVRLCAEPEAERYPGVLAIIEEALREYGGEGKFILTRRDSRTVATELTRALEAGAFVTTNLDVLLGGKSRQAFPLFGSAQVYLPALVGAARAALRTGALLLPWVNIRTESGFRLVIEPPIGPVPRLGRSIPDDDPELRSLCEQLRRILEGWIAAQPEQWFYWDRFHKRLIT